MNIVIIGQNEYNHMESMLNSLEKYYPNAKRIWVLDRCTDLSETFLKEKGETYVCTPSDWEGRRVSSARNLGLSLTDENEDVMFLDGDRFFVKAANDFEEYGTDIVLFKVQLDERNDFKWFTDYQQVYGHIHNAFYSCGLFMKRSAINKVLEFQGELFDTSIEQYWGVEDVHLGDVCYNLGLTCDIHKTIKLYGCFDNSKQIPKGAWRARIEKRLKLDNIIW